MFDQLQEFLTELPAPGGPDHLFIVGILIVAGILAWRAVWLYAQTPPPPAARATPAGSTTPSPPRARWWPSRTEKLAAQIDLLQAETDLILRRVEKERAQATLLSVQAELQAAVAEAEQRRVPPAQPAARPARETALTAREIRELIDAVADLDPQLRRSLIALFEARIEEKGP